MRKIVLATGNPGKVREFSAALAGSGVEIVPQSAFAVPEVEETGLSFVENALIKARHAARHTGLPALADDSGLVVDALGGAPGIYSARYAGPGTDDRANNSRLLTELQAWRKRNARPVSLVRWCCCVMRTTRCPYCVSKLGKASSSVNHAVVGASATIRCSSYRPKDAPPPNWIWRARTN